MIVGFGCKALVGKDTAASYLVEWYQFRRRAFADPVKGAAKAIFHLTDDQVYGSLKMTTDEYWGVPPRIILQKLGTECMRNGYAPDIWVRSLHRFMLLNKDTRDWVIPDVRFINEAEAIKNWGGIVIRIDRDVPEEAVAGLKDHPSENSLDNYRGWDCVINNNASIPVLHERLDAVMKGYGVRKDVKTLGGEHEPEEAFNRSPA